MIVPSPAPVRAALWRIDPTRSRVAFAVRHLGIATVRGRFASFSGQIELGEDGYDAAGSVDVASIETGNAIRDGRLRTEFFDVESFPAMTFTGRGVGDVVDGRLTIRGVTRRVTLDATVTERDGELHVQARGDLSRAEFGLDWEALRDAGRLLVSDRVRLTVDLVATWSAANA